MTLSAAKRILENAEAELRALIADAATHGRYDELAAITEIAKTLKETAEAVASTQAQSVPYAAKPTLSRLAQTPARGAKSTKSGKGYPRFRVDEGALVKVGWSKSTKSEYEHRAPTDVVEVLARRLTLVAKKQTLVTMDSVLPLQDASGLEIPSYQVYLALAWLRTEGLVVADGRKGYSLRETLLADSQRRLTDLATE